MISSVTRNNLDNMDIKIDNHVLNKVNQIQFLGVIIDDKLTWKPHINQLCTKLSQITGVLYKIRNCITTDCLRLIYMSTAYPHLLYCSAIWGGAYKTILDGLFIAQKKMIRIMFCRPRYEHTNPIFCEYKLLKVPDILVLQSCIFVFKSLHIYPVNTTYQQLSHNPNTRRPNDLRIPYSRTVQAQRGVSVRGVRNWNNLSPQIKSITSIDLFKYKIKMSIFQNYFT